MQPFVSFRSQYFNPLPRKEGDPSACEYVPDALVISIHSLVKRETRNCTAQQDRGNISIHSLVKRETVRETVYTTAPEFQSTPS